MSKPKEIFQPSRCIVGYCPDCRAVIIVTNEYGVWPYVVCKCGWQGSTQAIDNRARYERNGEVFDVYHPDVVA